jgi:hypothetical protein
VLRGRKEVKQFCWIVPLSSSQINNIFASNGVDVTMSIIDVFLKQNLSLKLLKLVVLDHTCHILYQRCQTDTADSQSALSERQLIQHQRRWRDH